MRAAEPPSDLPLPSATLLLRALLFGCAYAGCAALDGALTLRPGSFITFWLPSGLFMGTLLFHRGRQWYAFILAAAAANACFDHFNGQALPISLAFFAGNCLEAVAGALLVRRYVAKTPTLETLREVAGFTLGAAMGATAISATVGACVVAYVLKAGSFPASWFLW